jgi:hypothetical protein
MRDSRPSSSSLESNDASRTAPEPLLLVVAAAAAASTSALMAILAVCSRLRFVCLLRSFRDLRFSAPAADAATAALVLLPAAAVAGSAEAGAGAAAGNETATTGRGFRAGAAAAADDDSEAEDAAGEEQPKPDVDLLLPDRRDAAMAADDARGDRGVSLVATPGIGAGALLEEAEEDDLAECTTPLPGLAGGEAALFFNDARLGLPIAAALSFVFTGTTGESLPALGERDLAA